MDDKKIQETIEFILNNQAQFYSDLQQVQETNKELQELHLQAEKRASADEKRISQVERGFVGLYNFIDETAKISRENSEAIKELRNAQKETDDRLNETNDRLNVVIVMFEKFLGNQNGGSK